MTCKKGCNNDCYCENQIKTPEISCPTEDCGTCGGLNTTWSMENFYRSVIREKITNTQLPPFTVNVNKLPYSPRGLATLSPNTFQEEVVEYEYTEGNPTQPGQLTILKRGIHPAALNLNINGNGGNSAIIDCDGENVEVAPEFNNCDYMFEHLTNSEVQRDITAQDFNIFSQYTCCKNATKKSCGIVKTTLDSPNDDCPTVVSANDFANCNKNSGILRGLTKCVPEGEEIAVSWNDYASETNPGLVLIKNLDVEQVICGDGSISETVWNGNVPQMALHADQRAFKNVYGSVVLSKNNIDSRALAADDFAGTNKPGITSLKPVNTNPTCDDQVSDELADCPTSPRLVVQANDLANDTQYGLVKVSKNWDQDMPCPTVVSKHDWASPSNCGVVRIEDQCGVGCQTVPSMCTYSDVDKLGLTYQSVDTEDCNTYRTDKPTITTPISTSTDDKRNFRQTIYFYQNYTNEGTTPGLLVPAGGLGNASGIDFSNPNTAALAIENTGSTIPVSGINNGDFYCYSTMNNAGKNIIITQDGFYHLSFIVKFRNTKTQLEGPQLAGSSTVTHSARININGNNSEIGDLNLLMTTEGDSAYQPADPRYNDSIRTSIADSSGVRYLQAGDIIDLRVSFDNLDTYLLYVEIGVFCIQPTI